MNCPACGKTTSPAGDCLDPNCEMNASDGGNWTPVEEDLTTRTADEWMAELDLEGRLPAGFLEENEKGIMVYNKDRKYTKEHFMRLIFEG